MENLEIAVIAKNLEIGIAAFESRKAELTKLVAGYDSLAIKNASDKQGYQAVSAARKFLKVERVQIEKEGKMMRDPLTAMSKFVIDKEKELISITDPSERWLQEKEKWYESENYRIECEEREKEAGRIHGMADQLTEYNFPFNIETLKTITEEQFKEALDFAKDAFDKKESERIAFEKSEDDRKQAEADQLKKDREELQKLRAEQAETTRKQVEAQRLIDDQNQKIADEKAAIERRLQKVIEDKRRADELEAAKKKSADDARLKANLDLKIADEKKLEAVRKAQAAADKKARLAPDKDKLLAFADRLRSLVDFEVKSDEAKELVVKIQIALKNIQASILKESENL